MTRTHRRLALSALLLVLGTAAARAQDTKDAPAELLPAPRRCCDKPDCPDAPCCADKVGSPHAPCGAAKDCCPACTGTCEHAKKKDGVENGTTEEHARAKPVTRVYPVLDLVLPVANAPAPGCGSSKMATRQQPGTCPNAAARQCPKGTVEDVLIKLITDTIAPRSWANKGGSGTIDFFPLGMAVVVTQPPAIQKRVAALLAALQQYSEAMEEAAGQAAGSNPEAPAGCPVPFPDAGLPAVYPVPMMVEAVPPLPGPLGPLPPVRMSGRVIPPPPCYPPEACPPPAIGYAPPCPPPLPIPPAVALESNRTTAHGCKMRVVTEDGKEKLEIQSDSGALICESLEMKAPNCCGRLRLSAVSKQVQITDPTLTATADSVAGVGKPGYLLLVGHVQLKYHKSGQRAEVTAEHILIGLADGYLEIAPGGGPAKGPEAIRLTGFWSGFFKQ